MQILGILSSYLNVKSSSHGHMVLLCNAISKAWLFLPKGQSGEKTHSGSTQSPNSKWEDATSVIGSLRLQHECRAVAEPLCCWLTLKRPLFLRPHNSHTQQRHTLLIIQWYYNLHSDTPSNPEMKWPVTPGTEQAIKSPVWFQFWDICVSRTRVDQSAINCNQLYNKLSRKLHIYPSVCCLQEKIWIRERKKKVHNGPHMIGRHISGKCRSRTT